MSELLDRSKVGIEQKENWSNEYLSSFKVASYVTKEEEEVSIRFHSLLYEKHDFDVRDNLVSYFSGGRGQYRGDKTRG